MVNVLSFLQINFINLAILLVLTQNISLRIIKEQKLTLTISFTIISFRIELENKKKKAQPKKRNRKPKLAYRIKQYRLIADTAKLVLSKSSVIIRALDTEIKNDTARGCLLNGLFAIPKCIFISFLRQNALLFEDLSGYTEKDDNITFDIDIRVPLFQLIGILIIYFARVFKIKFTERKKATR